jgi:hypothetical protein
MIPSDLAPAGPRPATAPRAAQQRVGEGTGEGFAQHVAPEGDKATGKRSTGQAQAPAPAEPVVTPLPETVPPATDTAAPPPEGLADTLAVAAPVPVPAAPVEPPAPAQPAGASAAPPATLVAPAPAKTPAIPPAAAEPQARAEAGTPGPEAAPTAPPPPAPAPVVGTTLGPATAPGTTPAITPPPVAPAAATMVTPTPEAAPDDPAYPDVLPLAAGRAEASRPAPARTGATAPLPAGAAPLPPALPDAAAFAGGAGTDWRLELQATARAGHASRSAAAPQVSPREIAGQITLAIGQATQPLVEVRLDPPELGRVSIRLTPVDGGLQALVLAERPETQEFLRRNADTLLRDLDAAGYDSVDLDFGTGQGTDPRDARPERALQASLAAAWADAPAAAATQPEPPPPGGLARLDIRL